MFDSLRGIIIYMVILRRNSSFLLPIFLSWHPGKEKCANPFIIDSHKSTVFLIIVIYGFPKECAIAYLIYTTNL